MKYGTSETPHSHRCSVDGTIWFHDPKSFNHDSDENEKAHVCPQCGKQEYAIPNDDNAPTAPQFCSNGIRCIKLDGSGDTIIPATPLPYDREKAMRERFDQFLDLLLR